MRVSYKFLSTATDRFASEDDTEINNEDFLLDIFVYAVCGDIDGVAEGLITVGVLILKDVFPEWHEYHALTLCAMLVSGLGAAAKAIESLPRIVLEAISQNQRDGECTQFNVEQFNIVAG